MRDGGRPGGDIARKGSLVVEEHAIPVPRGLQWLADLSGGSAWLAKLPRLVGDCVRDWQLTVRAPIQAGSVSWVARADLPDGRPAVLKLSFPDRESEYEPDALSFWDGRGAVQLFAFDRARHAMLLERCEPGASLWGVADEERANRLAAGVLRCLWRPAPAEAPFRRLADAAGHWARVLPGRYERHGRPFARHLLDEALSLCGELANSQPELVVCHQDFHGGNVLSAGERGWLAIDPKPLLGERAFDIASLLRDRRDTLLSGPTPARMVRRRLDLLSSELALERQRMRGWAIVHALAWGLTDGDVYLPNIACAELLAAC